MGPPTALRAASVRLASTATETAPPAGLGDEASEVILAAARSSRRSVVLLVATVSDGLGTGVSLLVARGSIAKQIGFKEGQWISSEVEATQPSSSWNAGFDLHRSGRETVENKRCGPIDPT